MKIGDQEMKIFAYITGLILSVTSLSVSAIPVLTTGGADHIVSYGTIMPTSSANEQQFIADYLGVPSSEVSYTQIENSGGEDGVWMEVDDGNLATDLWAYDFGSPNVELFIVKFNSGRGVEYGGGSYSHFLYENFNQFGVIDLSVFSRTNGAGKPIAVTIDTVSHIGVVPEPSIIALLGIGLAGMAATRRRVKK